MIQGTLWAFFFSFVAIGSRVFSKDKNCAMIQVIMLVLVGSSATSFSFLISKILDTSFQSCQVPVAERCNYYHKGLSAILTDLRCGITSSRHEGVEVWAQINHIKEADIKFKRFPISSW